MFKILQHRLESNYHPRIEEFRAIDKIHQAYMTLASFEDSHPFAWEGTIPPAQTALGHLALAGRLAWETLLGAEAREFWDLMLDNGENAVYQWNLYAKANDI